MDLVDQHWQTNHSWGLPSMSCACINVCLCSQGTERLMNISFIRTKEDWEERAHGQSCFLSCSVGPLGSQTKVRTNVLRITTQTSLNPSLNQCKPKRLHQCKMKWKMRTMEIKYDIQVIFEGFLDTIYYSTFTFWCAASSICCSVVVHIITVMFLAMDRLIIKCFWMWTEYQIRILSDPSFSQLRTCCSVKRLNKK